MANALSAVYKFAIPVAVGFSLAQASIYDVKGGTRAVIFDRLSGVKNTVVNEGTHFLIPWLQKSIIYDVRTKPRNISTTTGSKDLQMVSLTLRVLHRPEVQMLPKIYQVWLAIYNASYQLLFHIMSSGIGNDPPACVNGRAANRAGVTSHSVKTMTSVFFPPSATKSSKPSLPNSMPPNLSHSVKPLARASEPTC